MGLMAWIASILVPLIKSGGSAAAKFSIETAKFLAYRTLMLIALFTIFPYLLHNVLSGLILDLMQWSVGYLAGMDSLGVLTIELYGLGAWIGQQIKIHECMSMYFAAVATRWVYETGKGLFYNSPSTAPNSIFVGPQVLGK